MKKCPNCKLINTYEAEVCDCGYSFVEQKNTNNQSNNKSHSVNLYDVILGIVVNLVLGVGITIFYFVVYVILYGLSFVSEPTHTKEKDMVLLLCILVYICLVLVINYLIKKYNFQSKNDNFKIIFLWLFIFFLTSFILLYKVMDFTEIISNVLFSFNKFTSIV